MEKETRVLTAGAGLLVMGEVEQRQVWGDFLALTRSLSVINLNPHHVLVETVTLRSGNEEAQTLPPYRFVLNVLMGPGDQAVVFDDDVHERVRRQSQDVYARFPFASLRAEKELTGPAPQVQLHVHLPHGEADVDVPVRQLGADGHGYVFHVVSRPPAAASASSSVEGRGSS